MDRYHTIEAKVKDTLTLAQTTLGLSMPPVTVYFDQRGASAGVARRRNGVYSIHFNKNMVDSSSFANIVSDVVPHEVAHIVCFAHPNLGKNHDKGWKRICQSLGGSGKRCHSEPATFLSGTFEYTTTTGATLRVSSVIHKRIQQGRIYQNQAYRGGGLLNKECTFTTIV